MDSNDEQRNSGKKFLKLFDSNDNKYSVELKLKIETEKAAAKKYKSQIDNFAINLSATRNNIKNIKRAIIFLRSQEVKIVILTEYITYINALPRLYREEHLFNEAIKKCNEGLELSLKKIASLESSIESTKTKILQFRKKNET